LIITYLRSSSYNTHSLCEQQYYIEYNLGIKSPSGKAAMSGTITHKVMEILSEIKLCKQNNTNEYIDNIVGKISTEEYNLEEITENVYVYYTSQPNNHVWMPKDLKKVLKNVNVMITSHNGEFDPRNRNIVSSEGHFDILIDKDWAEYEYDLPEGKIKGKLGIKGTIDLITESNTNTLEIIDLKCGKRKDWATGEEKTLAKLYKDPQLRMYHYAVSHMYPKYDHIIVTINYINDGGAFSVCFSGDDLAETEDMIRMKFMAIKKCKKPRLSRSWKCSKMCHFGKNTFVGHPSILPIIEYRDDQVCENGMPMTMCEQIRHDMNLMGIKDTTDKYQPDDYSVAHYKAPGAVE